MAQGQHLKDYQWKNRVILLLDHVKNSEIVVEQLKMFLALPEELRERQLLIFTVHPEGVLSPEGKPTDLSPD
ncbi:MAG: DUF4174 domain-containing protein, partial [Bacteroidota bacterium]